MRGGNAVFENWKIGSEMRFLANNRNNSKPIQSQFKANSKPIQSQFKANMSIR
jgi:hypothetical protein